ncbi:MAG: phosphatase PAP2 family protein [Lachnospiraceae bacterium]
MGFEFSILNFIQNFSSGWLDRLMIAITTLGNAGILWIILAAVLLLIPKTRKLGAAVALGLLLEAFCCNVILKPLVARTRPYEINEAITLLIAKPSDYSFPSGHTSASFAVVAALCRQRSKLWIPSLILAILIAFSRLYLYVHYPTDVLGGLVIGLAFGWLGSYLANRIRWNRNTR